MIKIFFIWFLGFVYNPNQITVQHSADLCITTESGATFVLMEGALYCDSNEFTGTIMYPKLFKRGNSVIVYSATNKPVIRFSKGRTGVAHSWYALPKPYER